MHLHVHQAFEEILLAMQDLETDDGAVLLGDGIGDIGQGGGFVGGDDADAADEAAGLAVLRFGAGAAKLGVVPVDIDEAFGRAAKLSSVRQSREWMVTPLPVVTMPTILSPGRGWQQPA